MASSYCIFSKNVCYLLCCVFLSTHFLFFSFCFQNACVVDLVAFVVYDVLSFVLSKHWCLYCFVCCVQAVCLLCVFLCAVSNKLVFCLHVCILRVKDFDKIGLDS